MGFDIETINTDITPEEDRGSAQRTLKREESRLHFATVSISFGENGQSKSQTKAHEIKGKWDSTLEHGAIVQYINEAEDCLLGMPRPYYSNMAFNPIIEQPASERGQSWRRSGPENILHIWPEYVNNLFSTPGPNWANTGWVITSSFFLWFTTKCLKSN